MESIMLPRYVLLLVSALALPVVTSCGKAEPAGAEFALFNGKDLTGWTVTECETEIKDGVLLLKAGEGWIRTDHQYADFVLSWECKNLKADSYDSGVHFRAELPKAPAHWPKKFQVNLKTDQEGNLTNVKEAASTGLYRKGEWNSFKLTVIGNTAELEINGKPAWKTDKIDAAVGYIGLQSEVTLGGQFEFRNIRIKELGKKTAFNGRNFEGWEGAGAPSAQAKKGRGYGASNNTPISTSASNTCSTPAATRACSSACPKTATITARRAASKCRCSTTFMKSTPSSSRINTVRACTTSSGPSRAMAAKSVSGTRWKSTASATGTASRTTVPW
jgi:hypothetical protein